jgi:site-specific DNA-methyltransferase (cytosine-N4-specific)
LAYPLLTTEALKPKDLIGIPWRVAFALQADGWYLRSDIIWHKPNPMPESVTDRPTKAHEYIFLLTKSARYYYDAEAIREPWTSKRSDMREKGVRTGLAYLQQEPLANNSKKPVKIPGGWDTGEGAHGTIHRNGRTEAQYQEATMKSGRNRRTVWTIATHPCKEAHFATFPPRLVEPCILAGCPAGGTVLDPFAGAGTTGMVAQQHGRDFIGIELNADYLEIARRRIDAAQPPLAAA